MARTYYVYIVANRSRTIYVGVTNNIHRRVLEHRSRTGRFTRKYMLRRLVFVEAMARPRDAIAREKQIKGWIRARKVALIEADNPNWDDLASTWYPDRPLSG